MGLCLHRTALALTMLSTAACAAPLAMPQRAGRDLTGRAVGVALYDRLKSTPGDMLVSPVSMLGAFGMVAHGARGETRSAIFDSLHLPDTPRFNTELGASLKQLDRASGDTMLSIANALWVQQDFTIRADFVQSADANFNAAVGKVDFRHGRAAAVDRINAWVAQRTNDRITEILAVDAVKPWTKLIVTNAVYFLATWNSPFRIGDTAPRPFYAGDGSVRFVPLMMQEARFRYLDMPALQVLDLPYKDRRLSMTVLLPKAQHGLAALETELGDNLTEWLSRVDATGSRLVRAYLPKVQMELDYDLKPALTAMGMGLAFSDRADFRGIADAPLTIDKVVQKTFLRIDEKGTEAAASTAVSIIPVSPRREPPIFRADHPFVFLIRDRVSGTLLFLGRVSTPVSPHGPASLGDVLRQQPPGL
jgi:serine protease inhibitor